MTTPTSRSARSSAPFLGQSGAAQAYSCELELDRNEVRIANIWAYRDGPLEAWRGKVSENVIGPGLPAELSARG